MVNERVDARSGRPQLAATQSFVYRGAVCATARTGWPRSVGIFSPARADATREDTRENRGGVALEPRGYSKAETLTAELPAFATIAVHRRSRALDNGRFSEIELLDNVAR